MANPAIEWTKVLIHPLGLAGYVLFLLFGLLARAKRKDERRWILPAALVAAVIALLGGLGLALRDVDHKVQETAISEPQHKPSPVATQQNDHAAQTSSGSGSPNVQGVQGDVTITVDQSGSKMPKTPISRTKPPKNQRNKEQ